LIGKALPKHVSGSLRNKCEGNIKVKLREESCEDGKWMELARDLFKYGAFNKDFFIS
jgi:hypothetical protein